MQAFSFFLFGGFFANSLGGSCQWRFDGATRGCFAGKSEYSNRTPSASTLTSSNLLLIKGQLLYWLGRASGKEVGDLAERPISPWRDY
jgi:hypothetical protein